MKKVGLLIMVLLLSALAYYLKPVDKELKPLNTTPSASSSRNSPELTPGVGSKPAFDLQLPAGFQLGIFAQDLGSARDLAFSPQGTLLVSVPRLGQIIGLPDKNADGVADEDIIILYDLENPHGMAFYKNWLFVAEETRVVRYVWNEADLVAREDKVLFKLPRGGRHTTRTISFDIDGRLFVSVGSTCDVCHEQDSWLAAVIVSDFDGNNPRLWAKGLRNSVFITINPTTQELWGTEMSRDFLGDDLPPDEINIIRSSQDYGWPICFGNRLHDADFDKKNYVRDPCLDTAIPIYEIPAHSAPLGLTFIRSAQFPDNWQGDLLVSYHGSWNRTRPTGYKVVRLDVENNTITGEEDFLSGFLPGSALIGPNSAHGRPVDLEFDSLGSLFVSDDKTGVVYKIVGNL